MIALTSDGNWHGDKVCVGVCNVAAQHCTISMHEIVSDKLLWNVTMPTWTIPYTLGCHAPGHPSEIWYQGQYDTEYYATPSLVMSPDMDTVFATSVNATSAFAADSGKLLWTVSFNGTFRAAPDKAGTNTFCTKQECF